MCFCPGTYRKDELLDTWKLQLGLYKPRQPNSKHRTKPHTGKYCGHSHTGEYCIHSDLSDDINQSAAGMEMEWVQKEGEM